MKTGLIVRVFGSEPPCFDANRAIQEIMQTTQADQIEIVTDKTGHYDVHDAWRSLLVVGMKHIACMTGEFTIKGTLRLTGRELRLWG
jgi:hypothetical protein